MTIKELIDEWEIIKKRCIHRVSPEIISLYDYYADGEEYDLWRMKCVRFLQIYYPDDAQAQRFIEIANNEDYNSRLYNEMISILKAIDEIPAIVNTDSIDNVLESIFTNFHRCAKSLLNRHEDRETLVINDEYDVQDLTGSILRLFVDDVRPEDCKPSYAGKNSRVDFLLPKYGIAIETKMIRKGLDDKKVGEELIIDIARYKNNSKKLICFIYDKNNELKNPYGLIRDLEKCSNEDLSVKVYISPL